MITVGLGLLIVVFAAATASQSPKMAAAAIGALVLVTLAFLWPAQHLTLTLFVAAIVPYDLQHRASAGGLVLIDVLILLGMAWGALTLARQRLDGRSALAVLLVAVFLALLLLQAVVSWRRGQGAGDVLLEFRQTFAVGTIIAAVALLANPDHRRSLLIGLLVGSLLLGLIGFAEWALHLPANSSDDFGVSNGAQISVTGAGKLLGGRYVYPSVVIVTFAVLSSGVTRTRAASVSLIVTMLICALDVILTLERAFWLATIFGLLVVVVRSGRVQRARALLYGGLGALLLTGMLSIVAPSSFGALRERLLSVGEYHSDTSVTYRLVESRFVLHEIEESPLTGKGLGSSVYWGIANLGIAPETKTYSHNAYLRLAWKVGIPLALFLVGLLIWLILVRHAPEAPGRGLRVGAQAALVTLFIMAITGPIFSTLSSMATIGVLGAFILMPGRTTGPMVRASV